MRGRDLWAYPLQRGYGGKLDHAPPPPPRDCEAGGGTAYRLERIDFADFGWPQKRQSPPAIETSGRAARELLGKK